MEKEETGRLKTITLYGLQVPKDAPRIAVELQCYRENRTKEQGGLGKEQHFRNAWALMWPDFQHNEWSDLMISAWCRYKWIIVIGHERAGKTFTFAFCALLDYLAEPFITLTSLATVTFEGLKLRMWSDLQRAHETGVIRGFLDGMTVRSTTNELRVYPTQSTQEAAQKYQIHGMAVQATQDAEGRIRGGHAARRRIFLDEAQNVAKPIFEAMINPMSAPDAKAVLLTNPVERVSEFGAWCEPLDGWTSIRDTDLHWPLKKFKDGICIHLDGRQSPNIRAGRTLFPWMLTQDNIDEIARVHGPDSVQMWSLVIGFFPPDGMVSRIFPASVIEKARGEIIFDFRPLICASLDPAFEFDNCVLNFGQLGAPVFGAKRYAINCTESIVLKFQSGPGAPPKDLQIAEQVMTECKKRGVRPEHFIMDATGGGRGVYALLWRDWSKDVRMVEYGGGATHRPLSTDNPQKCSELYMYFVTELWFRASVYAAGGLIGGMKNLDARTEEDLYARRYELRQATRGQVQVAETKKEMKKRLGRSPDFGDTFCQFAELLAQLGTFAGQTASMIQSGNAWAKSKEKAKKAAAIYEEAKEFSHFGLQ